MYITYRTVKCPSYIFVGYTGFMEPSERLRQIRAAAGYRFAKEAARAFGWNENTYSSHENGNRGIPAAAAKKYAARFKVSLDWLLEGKGIPPELPTQPADAPHQPDPPFKVADVKPPLATDMPKDLPVYGVGAGSNNGAFLLNDGEPIDFVRRPIGVSTRKNIFGIYVEGDSMEPRYEPGDLLICDPNRPARITDYVVVVVQVDESGYEEAYVGRLVSKSGGNVAIKKFNPPKTLELTHAKQVIKIINTNEMLGV